MIELISITVSFFILFSLSLFPFRINSFEKNNFFYNFKLFDIFLLNLIINIGFLLLISFTTISYTNYFILIIIISLIYSLFNLIKINKYFKFFKNKNFILFIILNFIIALHIISNPILAWDGLENWYFKAQNFFYNYNFFDLKGLKGNNYYPHLGSLIWGFLWKNSILQYEYLGRIFYIYIYLLSIFSLSGLIEKNNHLKIIIISLIIILSFDDFLFRGYQEVLLFSLFIFISKNFYIYLKSERSIHLIICFFCLNLIPWVKHEGTLLTFIYSISILFIIKYFSNKLQIISLIFITWFLLIFKNYIFYKYLDLNFAHGGGNKFFNESKNILEFIYLFSLGLFVALMKYKIWIAILVSFYFVQRNNLFSAKGKLYFSFLKINLTLFLILLLGIYYNLFTNSNIDFNWWIDNSLDRLIFSISGIFVIQIIFFSNYIKNYILK